MGQIQKILTTLFILIVSGMNSSTSAIKYKITKIDKEPIYIDGKEIYQYDTFSRSAKITNWANCTYFYCRSIEENPKTFFICKYGVKNTTLGSYIYSLKPLSSLGTIADLAEWFNQDYYAPYSIEDERILIDFECPDNLIIDKDHYFEIVFDGNDDKKHEMHLPSTWDENKGLYIVSLNITELIPYVDNSMRLELSLNYVDNTNNKILKISDKFNVCFIKL